VVTPIATLIEHARLSDLERAICRAIAKDGSIGGTVRELAETFDVNRSSLFRAFSSLERREVVLRSSKRGKSGSILVTFNGRAVDKLRALCDHLSGESDAAGTEYTAIPAGAEDAVREDRARLLNAKKARVAAMLQRVGQG
jgi:DNA-binding transcriptional regulator YhcF (GntR family)